MIENEQWDPEPGSSGFQSDVLANWTSGKWLLLIYTQFTGCSSRYFSTYLAELVSCQGEIYWTISIYLPLLHARVMVPRLVRASAWNSEDSVQALAESHAFFSLMSCCVMLERIHNAAASSYHIHSRDTYIVTARKWPTRHNFVIQNVLFPGTGQSHNSGDSTHPDVCLVLRQHIALERHSYYWMFYTWGLLDWQTAGSSVVYADSFQAVLCWP